MDTRPILIAGPTASGKSALAVALARLQDGAVINADSQQIYRDWHGLTARPSPDEEAAAAHRLYGHVGLDQAYSTGTWLAEIEEELARCRRDGTRPVIVGGTGLYFKALTRGLARIPPTPEALRARGEGLLEHLGLAAFVTALAARDPDSVAALDADNPRRVLRAWEVLEGTGKGMAQWHAETPAPLVPLDQAIAIKLVPDRGWLYARCDQRFELMIEAGVLDEVKAVMAMDLPESAPGLKAVGAPELMAHLRGEIPLAEAIDRAKMETRRYAKRQSTWLRNQMGDWRAVDPASPDDIAAVMDLAKG